jgi:hypothetical protein
MYSHVSKAWNAYADKDKYEVHLCYICIAERAFFDLYHNLLKLGKQKGLPVWPDNIATKINWNMIICAAPNDISTKFRASIPKVMFPHALCSSKIVDGAWYPYIPRYCFTGNGKSVFDIICEANEFAYKRIIQQDKRLADIIELTGNSIADELLLQNQNRKHIRNDMGYKDDEYVVLIQSTFGASLIEDIGDSLLQVCQKLASQDHKYKFIISLHPGHWTGDYAKQHPFGKKISKYSSENIKIRKPDEDANKSIIASDICVSDHTSLCFNYALLDKPLIFYIPPKASIIWEIFKPLVDICYVFDKVSLFEDILIQARKNYNSCSRREIMNKYVTYQGQFDVRINQVFDDLLNKKSH